jgi:SAM-dependent methyltransferase
VDVRRLYDEKIAQHYDSGADRGILAATRRLAAEQIERRGKDVSVERILDLALGTGESLLALGALFPGAKRVGIDVSERMIEIAKAKLEVTALHGDVREARRFVEAGSFDLVLMHFLLGMVEPDRALAAAAHALRPSGLFSVVTSTYESFPKLHFIAKSFVSEEFIRGGIHTPESTAEVLAILEGSGFEPIETEVHARPVVFSDFQDLYDFSARTGFFADSFAALTKEQLEVMRAATEFFPLEDEFRGTVVLARRQS